MVNIESCFVLRNGENIKLEKEVTPEEVEIMSLQQMHTAHFTLCAMRNFMKNKARRDHDCMTAYIECTGQAAEHTEKQDDSRNTSRIWECLSPEERKQMEWQVPSPAVRLLPVVTQLRLCRTSQGSWELPFEKLTAVSNRGFTAGNLLSRMPVVY